VNWSELEVADVPPGVVTVMSTVPVPAGSVAVTEVSEFTVTPVAAAAPKWTAVASVNPVPKMVTGVPPLAGPAFWLSPVTVGTGALTGPKVRSIAPTVSDPPGPPAPPTQAEADAHEMVSSEPTPLGRD
jgi:hypothetical protein